MDGPGRKHPLSTALQQTYLNPPVFAVDRFQRIRGAAALGQHLPVPVTFRFDAKVTTEALQLDEMLRCNPYVTVIRITATKLQDGFPDAIVSTADTIVGAATSLLVGQNGPPF